jgi:hypothetical protein
VYRELASLTCFCTSGVTSTVSAVPAVAGTLIVAIFVARSPPAAVHE